MRIRQKLLVAFLLITLLPLGLFGALNFYFSRQILESQLLTQLEQVADLKLLRIEAFYEDLRLEIETLRSFSVLRENIQILSRTVDDPAKPAFQTATDLLDGHLIPFQMGKRYVDVILLDLGGRVVYHANQQQQVKLGSLLDRVEREVVEQGRNRTYVSNIFREAKSKQRFVSYLSAPILDPNSVPVGVVVIKVGMSKIYKMIQDSTGLGHTGETLLVKKDGDGVLFLNTLRHDPNAALSRSIPFGDALALPAQEVVQGRSGSGRSVDYRGIDIIAAWRPFVVGDHHWGLVAKIDKEEALSPLDRLGGSFLAVALIALVMIFAMATGLARSISRPIQKLTHFVGEISRGDFRRQIEGITTKDEIGLLARAFNGMTEQLQETTVSRDALTKEVAVRKHAQEQLTSTNEIMEKQNHDLQKLAGDLQAANYELEQFSFAVSHDLQEPIRSIIGFVGLLKREIEPSLEAKAGRHLETIEKAAIRMSQLIQDLLQFARASKAELRLQQIDLNKILEEVLHDLEDQIGKRNACVSSDPLPNLPHASGLIENVFQNLISNAIKFVPSDRTPSVHVSAVEKTDEWVFCVEDNGIGIEEVYLQRIFDVFKRLHSRSEYPGTGIGLSICKRLVERHGGRIWAESIPGSGTKVIFTIPKHLIPSQLAPSLEPLDHARA